MRPTRPALLLALALALAPAAPGQFFGGSQKVYDKASWGLCTQAPCAIGTNLTVRWPVVYQAIQPRECTITAKTAPAGSALTVDIKRSTGASIFGTSKLTIAAGESTGTQATFSLAKLDKGDYLTLDITGVGSGTPGQSVTVACTFAANNPALVIPTSIIGPTGATGATGPTGPQGPAGSLTGLVRAIGFPFDGGGAALTAGKTLYMRIPFACGVSAWSVLSDTAETVTVKYWRVAAGSAIPTASNSISTAGVSLSTGKAVTSTTLSDFTSTAIAANDILAATLTAVTGSKFIEAQLSCTQP